jgi:DNA (cytosine-5)-methyltransferase 1
LVAAGPPCKGFSQIRNGYHDGRNGHNRVLNALPEYLAILRPRMFVIENVPDLLRHRNGKTLAGVIGRLERPASRLRYSVEYRIYDAALFGTPQARRRILIFGVRYGGAKHHLPPAGPDLAPLFAAIRHGGKAPKALEPYLQLLQGGVRLGPLESADKMRRGRRPRAEQGQRHRRTHPSQIQGAGC